MAPEAEFGTHPPRRRAVSDNAARPEALRRRPAAVLASATGPLVVLVPLVAGAALAAAERRLARRGPWRAGPPAR